VSFNLNKILHKLPSFWKFSKLSSKQWHWGWSERLCAKKRIELPQNNFLKTLHYLKTFLHPNTL